MRRTTGLGNTFESKIEVDNQPFGYTPLPLHPPIPTYSYPSLCSKKCSSSVFRLYENLFYTLISAKGSDYVIYRSNSENIPASSSVNLLVLSEFVSSFLFLVNQIPSSCNLLFHKDYLVKGWAFTKDTSMILHCTKNREFAHFMFRTQLWKSQTSAIHDYAGVRHKTSGTIV